MKTKVAGGTGGVVSGVPEYQLTLTIGMMLKTELQNRGYTVVMTRESNDVDISNKERADIATAAGAAATIRIHADGVDSASASGASVLVPGSSNPYYTGTGRQFQSVRKLYYQFVLCGNRHEKPRGSRK